MKTIGQVEQLVIQVAHCVQDNKKPIAQEYLDEGWEVVSVVPNGQYTTSRVSDGLFAEKSNWPVGLYLLVLQRVVRKPKEAASDLDLTDWQKRVDLLHENARGDDLGNE